MKQIEIGKIYRHFKGNYYFVEDIALDSERPDNITRQKYRFELQDNLSKDYTVK